MTLCLHCNTTYPDSEVTEGVCSICQVIIKYKNTLQRKGKLRHSYTGNFGKTTVRDRELPPSDRE